MLDFVHSRPLLSYVSRQATSSTKFQLFFDSYIVGVDMLNPETRCKYAILNIPELYKPIYLVFSLR